MQRLLTISMAPALPVLVAMTVLAGCGGDGDAERRASSDTSAASAPAAGSQPDPAGGQSTSAPAATTTSAPTPQDCGEGLGWDMVPRLVESNAEAGPIYLFDAGRHDCFDRLVFRLNGPGEVGYHVAYADGEAADPGSGDPLATAGDAALQLHMLAWVQGGFYDQTGHQPWAPPFAKDGEVIYPTSNPNGLTVVREVKFGGEYEAETDFAIGLSHRRPFQVTTYVDANQTRILVIDIAH